MKSIAFSSVRIGRHTVSNVVDPFSPTRNNTDTDDGSSISIWKTFSVVNFGRVRGFFLKNRDFALQDRVATVIAQIACHENSLPQGSPCSPVISNLVASVLDIRLVKLACESGCTYSRYADDITFSTNKRNFPFNIAVSAASDADQSHQWIPGTALNTVIERTGYRINSKKTNMMYRHSRRM